MSNQVVEFIDLLKSYKNEEDRFRANKLETALVYTMMSNKDFEVNEEDIDTKGVTFALDDNLYELFVDLSERESSYHGWKGEFFNTATLNQVLREMKAYQSGRTEEEMIVEPSFSNVLEILYDYRVETDKEKANAYYMKLIRLLLEHRVMDTENTTIAEISTQVGFNMKKDTYALMTTLEKGQPTGWRRNFLNRAVFNQIMAEIESNNIPK